MLIPILVADTNREFGILIRQTLEESERFEVSLASSAEEAVNLAKDLDFRLAIIDFALPDIDGEKVVERLRALQPGLAVIGIPVDDEGSSEKTRQAGVDGILTKPFYLPNLPDIIEDALGRRLDFHRPPQVAWPRRRSAEPPEAKPQAESPPAEASQALPGSDSPPPWLTDGDRAAQVLARLTQETSAEAALLIRHRELIAFTGQLPRSQVQELTAQVADSWAEEGRSGAVARFVHLPGTAEDFMLYATGVVADIVLSLVFSSEVPFGLIRRQAESLARALSEVDPAQLAPQAVGKPELDPPEPKPSKAGEKEIPAPEPEVQEIAPPQAAGQTEAHPEAEVSPLPEDWIPQPDQVSPSARLLAELASFQFPEPDPETNRQTTSPGGGPAPSPETPDLPLDWLPMITHSHRHLPFLLDPEPVEPETCVPPPSEAPQPESQPAKTPIDEIPAGTASPADTLPPQAKSAPTGMPPATPPKNPDPRLSFSLVFAPRFPEHRLAGPMVGKLDQWARRLCLAWDWKAERVDVSDDALLLQVMLPPDIAPAYAAQRLSENLSSQILETFPHLEPGFPTGGFWASAHMLVSGTAVTPEQVAAFVSQLRQAQGRGD